MSKSLEAEQHLIACALVDESKTAELLEINEDWFSLNSHKLIIRTIRELTRNNLSADMYSIGDNLNQTRQLEIAGGMEYLNELAESLPNLKFWNSYKTALFNYYKLRMIEQLNTNVSMQLGTGAKPEEIIEHMQTGLIELLTDHHQGGFKPIGDYLNEVIDELEWREQNPGQLLGQRSGFGELDYALDGWQDSRVYVIAGRPGSGKTAFALALADGLTSTAKPWFFFSLEMSGKSLTMRMIVRKSGVSNNKFRSGKVMDEHSGEIGRAVGAIQDRTLNVDQSPGLSVAQIRSRLKAAQVRYGTIGGIMVDHIGLVKKDARKSDTEAMNIIADELLVISKEFDCPMIELCQLNRGVEGRSDKRPMMSDVKQSGKIEENADVVILLYRDDYYDIAAAPVTEVNIAKSRDGESKVVYLKHDLSIGSYEQLTDYKPQITEIKRAKF